MPIPLPGVPHSLPGTIDPLQALDDSWTPRRIVEELDRHVVGQTAAKRAVAIALRNRMRRRLLPPDIAEDVVPKNILMIGPTGVGKTEIARRLARLAGSPFVKVEATKYTEVGYVGRDVESIIRDLVETAVRIVREEEMDAVRARAEGAAEERILDLLLPAPRPVPGGPGPHGAAPPYPADAEAAESFHRTREKMREALRAGRFDSREVTLTVRASAAPIGVFAMPGMESLDLNLQDMLPNLFPPTTQERKMTVAEARESLIREEQDRLVDMEQVGRRAIERAEQTGIVFLDELDKVAGRESGHGPDVSREGVQRDLLPIIEGTTVRTKYGNVDTHHVLFIAAGAFHVSKPSDLIPELQGRLPIRVEMDALTRADFVRILTEPKNALLKQAASLLGTEGVELRFSDDGIEAIAEFAERVNETAENIGARRLHTILERVLDRISFEAPERRGDRVTVDAEAVRDAVSDIVKDRDLSKFIL